MYRTTSGVRERHEQQPGVDFGSSAVRSCSAADRAGGKLGFVRWTRCGSGSPARTASTRPWTSLIRRPVAGRSEPAHLSRNRRSTEAPTAAARAGLLRRAPLEHGILVDVVAVERVLGSEVDGAVQLGDEVAGARRQEIDSDEVGADRRGRGDRERPCERRRCHRLDPPAERDVRTPLARRREAPRCADDAATRDDEPEVPAERRHELLGERTVLPEPVAVAETLELLLQLGRRARD